MYFGYDLLGKIPTHASKDYLPNVLHGIYKTEAQRENSELHQEMFNRFSNIAITRYQWEGLPDSISERFLNETLYLYGNCAFFEDENLGFLALPCTIAGAYNLYYEPIRVNAFSFNYNKMLSNTELDNEQFVYVRNNPTATPTAISVFTYTRRMCDILRSIDVIAKKMKQPFMVQCDESERLTIENLIKKIQDNETMVVGSKSFGLKNRAFEVTPLPSPQSLDQLWYSYRQLETILYTILGINSTGQEKKERLLVDEVNANNMVTDMSIEVNIKELQAACARVNKRWGLSIWVQAKSIEDYQIAPGAYMSLTGGELANG